MRKNNLPVIIISFVVIGIFILTMTSCKRNNEGDPEFTPNAGFRIALSGTANPSTLYVPEAQPPRNSQISVRALKNNGEPVEGFQVIFQVGSLGYLNDFKTSVVQTTDAMGMVYATYFLPPGVNIKATGYTNITVTLVDDGRLDHDLYALSQVEDIIPIRVIPYATDCIIIHGRVTTPGGNGVGGVTITLDGDDEYGLLNDVTVTRPSGSFEFCVPAGWFGTITPESSAYTFTPSTFDVLSPLIGDLYDVNFIATFAGGDTLAVDVNIWDNIAIAGGTQLVNVFNSTGDASIGYIVIPDSPWIHVSPNSGATPGSFTITVDENTTGDSRNGVITVTATDTTNSSVTISIAQLGGEVPSDARLAVDLETLNLPWEPDSISVNVYNSTTTDAISFIVTTIPQNDWISVNATSGTTRTTLTITVLGNYGEARTGQVILTPTSIGVSNTVTITVNQETGPSIAVTPETKNVGVGPENFTVTVTNPTTSDPVNFIVTNNDSWITPSPTYGNTPAQIRVTVNGNNTGQIRTGVVIFTDENNNVVTVTVTQQGT